MGLGEVKYRGVIRVYTMSGMRVRKYHNYYPIYTMGGKKCCTILPKLTNIIQCTLYNIHYTLYIVHCTLYRVYCTAYIIQCLHMTRTI